MFTIMLSAPGVLALKLSAKASADAVMKRRTGGTRARGFGGKMDGGGVQMGRGGVEYLIFWEV